MENNSNENQVSFISQFVKTLKSEAGPFTVILIMGYIGWLFIGLDYFFDVNILDNDYFGYQFLSDLQDYTGYIGLGIYYFLVMCFWVGVIIYAPVSTLMMIYNFIKKEMNSKDIK